MNIALITGAGGLIGSESVEFFSSKFDHIIGIDDNHRVLFFGKDASVEWNIKHLASEISNYKHHSVDIRIHESLKKIFQEYGKDISLVIHAAGQPSHDWAAQEPLTDFTVNANGTLNLLDLTHQYCPEAVFIFTSTNKVYGDHPNRLPLIELNERWEIDTAHPFCKNGIDETMSIDKTMHSFMGSSKLAADVMAQEYGRYFGMKTGIFRAGCVTGPKHAGARLHGFLSYLMKCAITGEPYTIFGYKGKQVRDNIHSRDLVTMFWHFYQNPKQGEVYNAGGSRHSNCSVLEAIKLCEKITGKKMNYKYTETNRKGDHIWWISDVTKFKFHYPQWDYQYDLDDILTQIYASMINKT